MDFLQGIPVEYELDAFSMPSTGTTSCHPKNWLCRSEHNSTLDTLVPFSRLVHTWRQRRLSPKYQIQNYRVTLNTISHTSDNTRCFLNISLRHFVLQHQKQTIFHAANKNFLCCVVKKKFRHSFVLPKKI